MRDPLRERGVEAAQIVGIRPDRDSQKSHGCAFGQLAMRVADAEQTLMDMLAAAGVDPDRPNPTGTWDVFKEFLAVQAEDAPADELFRDGMLFEWGVYDWHDGQGEQFTADFVRQFSLHVDGEYHHMEQLRCTFKFAPSEEFRALGSDVSLGGRDARIEAS